MKKAKGAEAYRGESEAPGGAREAPDGTGTAKEDFRMKDCLFITFALIGIATVFVKLYMGFWHLVAWL